MVEQDVASLASEVDHEKHGRYVRLRAGRILSGEDYSANQFRARISTDGSTLYAAEAGRYHLYLAIGCPFAQRAAIAINLMGLKDAVSYSLVDDVRDGRGWAFRATHGPDPVNKFQLLRDAYLATDPSFAGHVNVPT
jgi:glutathionyl-hydroquinone reductase